MFSFLWTTHRARPLALRGGRHGIYKERCPRPWGYNITLPQELLDSHMSFDFHARYGLLTYAQCGDLDPFGVCNHLSEMGAECIIAREAHADGGTHLHVFFDLGQKRRFRRANVFDVGGIHPNIEKSRGTPEIGYDYAIKEGDVVAGGLSRPEPASSNGSGLSKSDVTWATIVAAETRDEFYHLCRTLAPKSLCTSFNSIQRYADYAYMDKPIEYSTPDGTFDLRGYPGLQAWSEGFNSSIEGTLRGKCARQLRQQVASPRETFHIGVDSKGLLLFRDQWKRTKPRPLRR